MASLSISDFLNAVSAGNGPTLASQFLVNFFLPDALTAVNTAYQPDALSILCQSVTVGGVQLATTEHNVYGPPVKVPHARVYQDLNVSFLCTNDMAQRILFEEWQRLAVDPTTNYVGYFDDYVGGLQVNKLNQDGEIIHTVSYEDAWPVAIFEQELSVENNTVLRLTVQFSYRRPRTVFDQAAASAAGYGETEIPVAPGEDQNPNDIFKTTEVHKVPKFTP